MSRPFGDTVATFQERVWTIPSPGWRHPGGRRQSPCEWQNQRENGAAAGLALEIEVPVEHPGPVGHVSEAVMPFSRAGRQIETDAIIGYFEHQASSLEVPRDFDARCAGVAHGVRECL